MNKNIVIIVILFIAVAGCIIPTELNNLDEIWNFNFGKNISNGKLPYKDFNMVQTPVSVMFSGLVLKIFGNELLAMRILGCILCTAIIYFSYKILDKLKVNKSVVYLALLIIFAVHSNYFTYDYNYLLLLITLITMYFELDSNILKSNIKKDIMLRNFSRDKYSS